MELYHAINFRQPHSLLCAKLYIDPKYISNGIIKKGSKLNGTLVVFKEPTLSHHGIKGQKWGERRFQDQHGNWTRLGLERRRTGNRISKGTEFRTYSHRPIAAIRKGQYASYTDWDNNVYFDTFFENELGHDDSTESYRVEMKAKRDIILTNKKDTMTAVLESGLQLRMTFESDSLGTVTMKDCKKAYKHLQKAGYFDMLDKTIEERQAFIFNNPDPKENTKNKNSLWNDCRRLAMLSHATIYRNREGFAELFKKRGYDAIFDPEDLLYCYDAPIIITNPDAFELGDSVPIKDPDAK